MGRTGMMGGEKIRVFRRFIRMIPTVIVCKGGLTWVKIHGFSIFVDSPGSWTLGAGYDGRVFH